MLKQARSNLTDITQMNVAWNKIGSAQKQKATRFSACRMKNKAAKAWAANAYAHLGRVLTIGWSSTTPHVPQ
jgi:hypothetical protein